mgnify:CR=1 FL=1
MQKVAEAPRQLALRRPRLADDILAFSKRLQGLYFPCTFRLCNSARSRKSCDLPCTVYFCPARWLPEPAIHFASPCITEYSVRKQTRNVMHQPTLANQVAGRLAACVIGTEVNTFISLHIRPITRATSKVRNTRW